MPCCRKRPTPAETRSGRPSPGISVVAPAMPPSYRRSCRPVVFCRRQEDNCLVLVYVTLNTLEEGQRLAELLMARQLTNCVNFHPITCTYLWEGKITTEPEVVALIKTQAEHFDAIVTAVQETVPYTNFVGQLEVTRVNEAFAAWLESVVRS